jgi:hypothetical protein
VRAPCFVDLVKLQLVVAVSLQPPEWPRNDNLGFILVHGFDHRLEAGSTSPSE